VNGRNFNAKTQRALVAQAKKTSRRRKAPDLKQRINAESTDLFFPVIRVLSC
jgi:hypothetical protein